MKTNKNRTIQIAGKTYIVERCDARTRYSDNRAGWCSVEQQKIVLNTNWLQQAQDEALIHEIFEILNFQCDLQMSHQTISTLGECFYQILVANVLSRKKES